MRWIDSQETLNAQRMLASVGNKTISRCQVQCDPIGTKAQVAKRSYSGNRRGLDEFLRNRGFMSPLESRYKDPWFHVEDWDFDPACWARWEGLTAENPAIWSVLVDRILREKESYWSSYASARIVEVASNGNQRTITRQGVAPSWILRFRDLPCLPDTRGFRRKPDELLRRTPEPEALIGVESFVDGNLDREAARPLLDLLGVRSTPIGPDALLNRLRALAKAESPPVHEVEKCYNRIDRMLTTCSTSDFQKIRQAFHSEADHPDAAGRLGSITCCLFVNGRSGCAGRRSRPNVS